MENSEKELLISFGKVLKGPARSIVDDSVALTPFKGEEIYAKLKYPSEDNLKKLFHRLGVENVFARLSAQLKQDAIALLQSLGSLRTQLAHTGTVPGVSCKDVRDRLLDAERFVGAIDRLMFKITASNAGLPIWIAHLC